MTLFTGSLKKVLLVLFCLQVVYFLSSCNKEKPVPSEKEIISFILKHADNSGFNTADITVTIKKDTISVELPANTNLTGLIPEIEIKGVSISPSTGITQDFSKPVIYTVKAQDGSSITYTVIVTLKGQAAILYVGSSNNNFYAIDAVTGLLKWKYTGGGWFSYASPTLYNGIVYAGCTDNNIYAFDALTGDVKWKYTTGGSIESSLSVKDGVVYAGSDDHALYALDATTGNLVWKFVTGANVSSSPAVLNGIVYFGSSDNNVYALNITDGSLKWVFSTQAMINQSGASISHAVVFIGSRDGFLYAIDALTGLQKWKFYAEGVSLEQSSPTVSNGVVYIGGWYDIPGFSTGGSVYAVDEGTGTLLWKSLDHLGFSSSPYINNSILYISADDGNFYAINSSTGSALWSKQILPNGAGATVANGIVYTGGGGTGNIYAFNAVTGDEIWRFPVPGGLSNSSPCVVDNKGVVCLPGISGEQF